MIANAERGEIELRIGEADDKLLILRPTWNAIVKMKVYLGGITLGEAFNRVAMLDVETVVKMLGFLARESGHKVTDAEIGDFTVGGNMHYVMEQARRLLVNMSSGGR